MSDLISAMVPNILYERVADRIFRVLELDTVDGFAYVWIWGDMDSDDNYEEHIGLTMGLDGIE